jgi:hypothetical protein
MLAGMLAGAPVLVHSQSNQNTGWFAITGVYLSQAGNMTLRVNGMPAITGCPASPNWAYVDEGDSGSKEKVAALLTAYAAGKTVNLLIAPINYYGDGQMFCHIIEFSTSA